MTDSARHATSNLAISDTAERGNSQAHAAWFADMAGLILDLDGTLIRGDEVLPGAAALLHAYQGRYVIVSNNSTHTAPLLARQLQQAGLPVKADELVLAGERTVSHLREQHDAARILMLASPALKEHARHLGCRLVEEDAEIVVLARDERFDYAALKLVANEIAHGARLIVSNTDLTHPGPGGAIVPETGSLLQAVQACSGAAPLHVIGKPGTALFQEGLRRLDIAAAQALVIGDNPYTDALGAVAMGMRYLLVGASPHADAATLAQLMRQSGKAHASLPALSGLSVADSSAPRGKSSITLE